MSEQKEKQFHFQVDLEWLVKQKGILSADDAEGAIQVATPPVFGGEGRPWTPEHLFLGSISSCFMTTYLNFAKKFKFEISNLSCDAKGVLNMVAGKLIFTRIDLFSKIRIPSKDLLERANLALEKTKKYCIISNSITPNVSYNCEFMVDEEAGLVADMKMNKTA